MPKRIPQPAVIAARRDPEHHDFWPGLVITLIGLLLAVAGAQRVTGVDTVDGTTATETQLVRAFSTGGLQFPDAAADLPPPPKAGDPGGAAAALDRWAKKQAASAPATWKVRVDTGATTPCPT